jgi:ABC-type nickel/cobalt efflux system permease component RcnA
MTRVGIAAAVLLPALAVAHPLGNFTVNRWLGVRVEPSTVRVRYVVDMAEIPAFQAIRAADTDGDGALDERERAAYLGALAPDIARGIVLDVDGRRVALEPVARALELPPGAGGLPTLRVELTYAAALRGAVVEVRDGNFAGRPGWRELVAQAGDGAALAGSTVPSTDRSDALRAYPTDLLQTPPQVSEARFRVVAAAAPRAAPSSVAPAATVGADRRRDRLTELVAGSGPLGVGVVLASLLVAAALGAVHALEPGHGKSIVGAYLVGARGTARHAAILGLVVTATHTIGVYALGLATLAASRWVVPDRLFPWLGAASGVLVVGIGASLAGARLAGGHAHHHGENRDQGHDHDHGHDHLPRAGEPITWRALLALGVSGGLVPCPSALVVMLGAIAARRVAFGLALIVAFSAGLATVLTAIGLVFVRARRWFDRLPAAGRLARWAPVASALVVSAAGVLIVARAIGQME